MSKTPRTDKLQTTINNTEGSHAGDIVKACNFARKLERELGVANANLAFRRKLIDQMRAKVRRYDWIIAQVYEHGTIGMDALGSAYDETTKKMIGGGFSVESAEGLGVHDSLEEAIDEAMKNAEERAAKSPTYTCGLCSSHNPEHRCPCR